MYNNKLYADGVYGMLKVRWVLKLETPMVIRNGKFIHYKSREKANSKNRGLGIEFGWSKSTDKDKPDVAALHYGYEIRDGKVQAYHFVPASGVRGAFRSWVIDHLVHPEYRQWITPKKKENDEAVDKADAGKRFAAAGGHLDQGLGFVGGEGFFQVGDGAYLGGPQGIVRAAAAPFGDELGHAAHAGEEGARGFVDGWLLAGGADRVGQVGQPLHQQLGAEEGEHAAGAWLGVQAVGEVGFNPSALPHKGQRAAPGGQGGGQAFGVAAALQFDAGERGALFLGFDDAAGFAVDVEHVVGKPKAVVQRKFANCHAHCRMDIGLGHIANVPARRYQQCIYRYPGFGLWCHACSLCGRF